jgi:hypothetical protein
MKDVVVASGTVIIFSCGANLGCPKRHKSKNYAKQVSFLFCDVSRPQDIQRLSQKEAHKIANRFFSEFLGAPAVKNVNAILQEYQAANEVGISSAIGHGVRVRSLPSGRAQQDTLLAFEHAF